MIWNDNSDNEVRFVIEASEGNNLNYDSVGQATRPNGWTRNQGAVRISSINGVALKNNTTYFFRVRASASGGKSAPSNEISVTTSQNCIATSAFPQNRSWTATTLNTSGVSVIDRFKSNPDWQ
ncbi:MAG: fibronectin type III domain-containing protein [Cytophagales bacterium]|nr:fibronectin type III domain-containing protein [Cytophagales bacterium]